VIAIGDHSKGFTIAIKAQPGAKKNAVLGERNEALRVAVTAAPEKGKANDAIAEVLAKALGLKANQIEMLTGETSREKRFLIAGITKADLTSKLQALVDGLS
jgi:hypothetical protein